MSGGLGSGEMDAVVLVGQRVSVHHVPAEAPVGRVAAEGERLHCPVAAEACDRFRSDTEDVLDDPAETLGRRAGTRVP